MQYKKAYLAYFGVKIGDQDKAWAPHIVCEKCTEHLRQWNKRKRRSLKFGVSMIWRELANHFDDCYFCLTKIIGIKKNNCRNWTYPDLPSASRPVPHSEEIPIPLFHQLAEISEDENDD